MRVLLLLCCACCACVDPVVHGFAPDPAGGVAGGRLTVDADVDGQRATIHVLANDVGSAFGMSFHVVARGDDVVVGEATSAPLFGDDGLTIARIVDHDVALGGTRTSLAVGEADVENGEVATVEVEGTGTTRVEIEGAVVRRIDGAFVALAAAGGTITFGGSP